MSHYKNFRLKSLNQLTATGLFVIAVSACSMLPEVPTLPEGMVSLTLEDEIYSFLNMLVHLHCLASRQISHRAVFPHLAV